MKKQSFRGIGFYIAFLVILGIAYYFAKTTVDSRYDYTYEQFIKALDDKEVTAVTIKQNREVPTGQVLVKLKGSNDYRKFYVTDTGDIEKLLEKEYDIYPQVTDVPKDSTFLTTILPLIISVLFIVVIIAMMNNRAANSGGTNAKMMNFGKSRARMFNAAQGKNVTFKNVAGLQEEKEELTEIVDFLKNPKKYIQLGARIPKGVLLVGPPGTGKTLLAKAVAGEAGVPFFSISGSDFVEMFVGVGASRVRDLFEDAKKNAPCIVFIDEIDAVARRRGTGMGGGHDEREQTLNQLLVEMDGFGVNEGIIVMSATNRVDILDPAILRPGRFDRKVAVGRPDVKGRREILEEE